MALSSAIVWELRTAGSDTNSGGFKSGASGTDWSQQAAPQYSVTDAVTNGSTTITSATANFGTDVVGNVLYIQGGSATITAGWYEITSRTNSTTIVVDRSTGLTAGTGATLKIGGALATFNTLKVIMVDGNKAFVKADGTYTSAANLTWSVGSNPNNSNPVTGIIGYTTTRGDNGQAALTFNTATTAYGMNVAAAVTLRNIAITCNGNSHGGINLNFGNSRAINCKVSGSGASVYGINAANGSSSTVVGCEVTGMLTSTLGGIGVGGSAYTLNCWVHDGVGPGIDCAGGLAINCVVSNATGASAGDGFKITASGFVGTLNCTAYGNARHGIFASSSNYFIALNNLLAQNGGYGMSSNSSIAADPLMDGNAFYSNTSGTTNNLSNTATAPNGTNAYTPANNVTLTADPFVAKASNDFRLNTTAGGGAAARNAGVPKSFPGIAAPLSQPYPDFGAVPHQDAGGSSTYVINQTINRFIVNEGEY